MKEQLFTLIIILFLIIVGFNGCIEEKSENQDNSKNQIIGEVILTTDKNEYISGEKLKLTFVNNKDYSIYNQGGPLPDPSPVKSYDYGIQKFVNGSWREFQLVREETWKHIGDPVIKVVVDCVEYPSNSTNMEQISLTFFVYNDSGNYYENIPTGQYRLYKSFYNECSNDFSTNWSEPFTVYSNEFIIYTSTKDVLIITDKAEYKQGEIINFTVYSLSGSISYLFYDCDQCYLNEERFKIYFLNNSNWTYIPTGIDPSEILCPQCVSLGPQIRSISTPFNSSWDQQQRKTGQVKPGTYRICVIDIINIGADGEIYYSNEFTIHLAI